MTVFTNAIKTTLLLGILMGLCMAIGSYWGQNGVIMGFVFGGLGALFTYFGCAKLALMGVGAREVFEDENADLFAIVRRLTQRAGLPMPRIYIAPLEAPNAFATGRNPKHGVVCVTEGILRMLNEKELEGVLGHELSHIKHRDILISTLAAVMAGAISQLAYMSMWGFGGDRRNREGGNPLIGLVLMLLAPLAAMLIQMAISRSREYAADAGGSYLCGGPEGLVNALRKLDAANHQIPMPINPSQSHMFIVHPLTGLGEGLAGLFMTHPPTEQRIARLVADMQRGGNQYATQ